MQLHLCFEQFELVWDELVNFFCMAFNLVVERVDTEVRNSLFKLLYCLLVEVQITENALKNIGLPAPDLNEVGNEREYSKIRSKLSSNWGKN